MKKIRKHTNITFDQILYAVSEVFKSSAGNNMDVKVLGKIIINRDLNGRICLILEEKSKGQKDIIQWLETEMLKNLGTHCCSEHFVLYESEEDWDDVIQGSPSFPLEGFDNVRVIDRLVTGNFFGEIESDDVGSNIIDKKPPRIIFFAIKGGIGRATSLINTGRALAESGKRVLVLDMDIQSHGISSFFLTDKERHVYGIIDWLVEDLVNNEEWVFKNLIGPMNLAHESEGKLFVIPANGINQDEYISKIGRVLMPKIISDGIKELLPKRLNRLLNKMEKHLTPDIVLIYTSCGINDITSVCLTQLNAHKVFLFSKNNEQTFSCYHILLKHLIRIGLAAQIRNKFEFVGVMNHKDSYQKFYDTLIEQFYHKYALPEPHHPLLIQQNECLFF